MWWKTTPDSTPDMSAHINEIAVNCDQIDDIRIDITVLKDTIASLGLPDDAMTDIVLELQRLSDRLKSSVWKIEGRLSDIRSDNDQLKSLIEYWQEKAEEQEAKVAQAYDQIGQLKESVSDLQGEVSGLQDEINSIHESYNQG